MSYTRRAREIEEEVRRRVDGRRSANTQSGTKRVENARNTCVGRQSCDFIFVSFLSDISVLTRGRFLHHYIRSSLSSFVLARGLSATYAE